MKEYELIFLLAKEEKKALDKIETIVKSLKGSIEKKESWGKKMLAYKIKGFVNAYYYSWILKLEKQSVKNFVDKLNLENSIIRYLLLEHKSN